MGEYAIRKSDDENIKIGTCEDMYYIRYDQRMLVTAQAGNVDPVEDGEGGKLRFRFPFPDEDKVKPGEFEDHGRALMMYVPPPADLDHSSIQFSAPPGYLVSLPCPESEESKGLAARENLCFFRNGFPGNSGICQQKVFHGKLITIGRCSCGSLFRLETLEMAQPYIDDLRKRALQAKEAPTGFFTQIAMRMAAGYTLDLPVVERNKAAKALAASFKPEKAARHAHA